MTDLLEQVVPVAKGVVLNTAHARAMLRKRFVQGEWALMEEVAPTTGGGTRYADAVAVNLWKSRGHAIHGVEIKVSRSDWLRELKSPVKAESVHTYCNYWWIAAPAGVVKDGELPTTWGLLELRAGGLVQIVAAPKLSPQPIDIGFFASLMRRGVEALDAVAEERMRVTVAQSRAEIDERVQRMVKDSTREHERLREQLAELERDTGISLHKYHGPPIACIKLAQRLERLTGWEADSPMFSRLVDIADQLDKAALLIREAVDEKTLLKPEQSL